VVLVTGPEDLRVDRAVRAVGERALESLREAAPGGDAAVDVHQVVAADLQPGELAAFTSPSLFGETPVVVLRDVQAAPKGVLDEVTAYLQAPSPDVVLVLTHTGGAKGKGVLDAARRAGADEIACPKVTRPGERLAFVRDELRVQGRNATEQAARVLLEAVGPDLRELANACDQLASDTEGTIDEETVARYYRGRADITSFQVADAAVEGRTVEALQQVRWLLGLGDTRSPLGVVVALGQGLRQIVRVGAAPRGAKPADLARDLGMPPWKVDRVRRQVRGWTPEALATAITAVAEADEAVKTGADKAYAVERAVVAVAQARSGG